MLRNGDSVIHMKTPKLVFKVVKQVKLRLRYGETSIYLLELHHKGKFFGYSREENIKKVKNV